MLEVRHVRSNLLLSQGLFSMTVQQDSNIIGNCLPQQPFALACTIRSRARG